MARRSRSSGGESIIVHIFAFLLFPKLYLTLLVLYLAAKSEMVRWLLGLILLLAGVGYIQSNPNLSQRVVSVPVLAWAYLGILWDFVLRLPSLLQRFEVPEFVEAVAFYGGIVVAILGSIQPYQYLSDAIEGAADRFTGFVQRRNFREILRSGAIVAAASSTGAVLLSLMLALITEHHSPLLFVDRGRSIFGLLLLVAEVVLMVVVAVLLLILVLVGVSLLIDLLVSASHLLTGGKHLTFLGLLVVAISIYPYATNQGYRTFVLGAALFVLLLGAPYALRLLRMEGDERSALGRLTVRSVVKAVMVCSAFVYSGIALAVAYPMTTFSTWHHYEKVSWDEPLEAPILTPAGNSVLNVALGSVTFRNWLFRPELVSVESFDDARSYGNLAFAVDLEGETDYVGVRIEVTHQGADGRYKPLVTKAYPYHGYLDYVVVSAPLEHLLENGEPEGRLKIDLFYHPVRAHPTESFELQWAQASVPIASFTLAVRRDTRQITQFHAGLPGR
ncbi:MAG: hypothetical protein AAGD01_05300 [Acidobacteriota bacterium]